MNTPNARFWHWSTGHTDGWVKITLKPGQSLSWHESHRTDEGYSFQAYTWTHDGDSVTRKWLDGGRDCDGPIQRTGTDSCPLNKLAECQPVYEPEMHDDKAICRPDWQEAEPTQINDLYAQLSNY